MLRRVHTAAALTGLIALAIAACGGGQTQRGLFSESWREDNGKSIDAVRQKLDGVVIPMGADVAVGVAGHSTKLIGQPLGGGARWTFAHPVDSRPVITGAVVVATGGSELFAVDALTGKRLWARPIRWPRPSRRRGRRRRDGRDADPRRLEGLDAPRGRA